MSVSKPKNSDGRLYKKYYVFYIDHLGKKRNIPGFTDKSATKSLERMIEKLVSYRVSNKPFDQELMSCIESLKPRLIKKFAEIGLIDFQTSAVIKPLMVAKKIHRKHSGKDILVFRIENGHLADYQAYLVAAELTRDHIRESTNHIARFIDSQNVFYSTDINHSNIQRYISVVRDSGVSAARINAAISAIKAFCNWMVKEDRMINNPTKGIKKLNVKADRRYVRSVLTQPEVGKLFEFLPTTSLHHGLCYQLRSLIYKIALNAGLRWNEIYTLKRSDFNLDTQPPTITVRAENEKAGRGATLPLEKSLAEDLKEYFDENPIMPSSRAIRGMWKRKGAEMLRQDLKIAGINSKRASGEVIDFHGLRHTYGTMLAQAGVMPAQLKRLMRHSNVQLTMDYYTHLSLDHLNDEIAKISDTKTEGTEKCTIPDKVGTVIRNEQKEVNNEKCVDLCGTECGVNSAKLLPFTGYGVFSSNDNVWEKKP